MSFGFGVGDFIAVLDKANKLRDRFADAPDQFKAISNEVSSLTTVLRDIENLLPQHVLAEWQKRALKPLLEECHNVVITVGSVIDQNYYLEPSNAHGIRNKARRTWKRLTWEPKDIEELRLRMASNLTFLNAFTGSLTSKVALDTKASVERLHERQDNREHTEEHARILNWLTTIDYAPQQNDYIGRRQPGTGQWLLDSPEFQEWVQGDKQTLFCPGIPGAGKTILTAIVIEDLFDQFHEDSTIGITYIYCNFRRRDEQKLDDLLASLLKQLCEPHSSTPKAVKDLYNRHNPRRTRPSVDEISRALQSIAASFSRVFVVVDALDECQTADGCRARFLAEIFAIQAKSNTNIFTTSRFLPEIGERFDKSTRLEVRATPDDVGSYLDGHMAQLSGCVTRNQDLQAEIKAAIIDVVDGMFLLAQLHFESLKGKKAPKAIRSALKTLPTGGAAYDKAYQDAMVRIEGQLKDERSLAKQVLSWITCAKRPLQTFELEHALAVEVGESKLDEENICPTDDMVSVCAGLVTVDKESGIIRLVHYTTQDYFQRTQKQWFSTAEKDISIICVTYLSFGQFATGPCSTDDEYKQRLQSNPLYVYASQNWGHHTRQALISSAHITGFLSRHALVESSSQALFAGEGWGNQKFPSQMTGMHLAAYFGVVKVAAELIGMEFETDVKDQRGRTPLSWAAGSGHDEVVKLLLSVLFVDIDSNATGYDEGRTPLSYAAQNGHYTVVELLIEHGANPAVEEHSLPPEWEYRYTNTGRVYYVDHCTQSTTWKDPRENFDRENGGCKTQTALSWAAAGGHHAIIKLLLDTGKVEADSKANDGRTPLSWAAGNGHEAVVKMLLDTGKIDVDSKDTTYGQTPLSWAAENGYEAVVKMLLDTGKANVDSRDTKYGQTPLSWAAENGHEAVVKMLLDTGKVDVDSKDTTYSQTPLSWAAENGYEAVVKILLDTGKANVDSRDRDGQTPLLWAARNRREAVMRILLDTGKVDIDSRDRYGRTPLSWAAENGHEEAVRILLDTGKVDINSRDRDGRIPLLWAARNGREAVAKVLLDTGKVDIAAEDACGLTALQLAAFNWHTGMEELLIARGGPIVPDFYGLQALF